MRPMSPPRARWGAQARTNVWRLGLLVLGAGAWEAATRFGVVNAFWGSSPSRIVVDLVKRIGGGEVFFHIAVTLYEAFLGFVLGAAVGIAARLPPAPFRELARG